MILLKYIRSYTKTLSACIINNGNYCHQLLPRRWISKSMIKSNLPKQQNVREVAFKKSDKVKETFTLIYKAPMENYISLTKHSSSFTCLTIAGLYMYNLYLKKYSNSTGQQETDVDKAVSNEPKDVYMGVPNEKLSTKEGDVDKFAIGFVIINVLVFLFSSRYPLRIYKHNQNYVAILEGPLPLFKTHLPFKGGQIKEAPGGIWFWRDIRYKIRNKVVYLLNDHFKSINELNLMLRSTVPKEKI